MRNQTTSDACAEDSFLSPLSFLLGKVDPSMEDATIKTKFFGFRELSTWPNYRNAFNSDPITIITG